MVHTCWSGVCDRVPGEWWFHAKVMFCQPSSPATAAYTPVSGVCDLVSSFNGRWMLSCQIHVLLTIITGHSGLHTCIKCLRPCARRVIISCKIHVLSTIITGHSGLHTCWSGVCDLVSSFNGRWMLSCQIHVLHRSFDLPYQPCSWAMQLAYILTHIHMLTWVFI